MFISTFMATINIFLSLSFVDAVAFRPKKKHLAKDEWKKVSNQGNVSESEIVQWEIEIYWLGN